MPHHMGLGVTVQEKKRWSVPSMAYTENRFLGIDHPDLEAVEHEISVTGVSDWTADVFRPCCAVAEIAKAEALRTPAFPGFR